MIRKIGLIGKGGFVKEVFASINKNIRPYILNDIDGTLQDFIKHNFSVKYLLCIGIMNILLQFRNDRY